MKRYFTPSYGLHVLLTSVVGKHPLNYGVLSFSFLRERQSVAISPGLIPFSFATFADVPSCHPCLRV